MRTLRVLVPAMVVIIAGTSAMGNTYTVTKTSMGGSSAGRLDTAINSANSNPGADTIAFDIPTSDGGYDATRGVWRFVLTADLPAITGDVTIDGTTQTTARGNTNAALLGTSEFVGVDGLSLSQVAGPEIEITGDLFGMYVTGGSITLKSIAFLKQSFGVRISNTAGSNNLITGCVFGVTANAVAAPAPGEESSGGVTAQASTTIADSIFAFINYYSVSASSATITLQNSQLFNNLHTVLWVGFSSTITGNLIHSNLNTGIYISGGSSHNIVNNTIRNNGLGGTAWEEGILATRNSSSTVDRNLIYNNYGPGVGITPGAGFFPSMWLTRNSIYGNGTITNNVGTPATGQIGINLTNTEFLFSQPYVTLNDLGDTDTGSNGQLNYPVLSTASLVGSNLIITGWARPGSVIELFIAESPADASGFGEGKTYLTTLTEGSGSDTAATSSTYGPGAINGISQGTDTTNQFSFSVAIPGGVTAGTELTATATLSNATSEFSGNVTVTLPPNVPLVKSVTPSGTQQPGTDLVYTVVFTNDGGVAAQSFIIIDPIPLNTDFKLGSSGTVLGTTGMTVAIAYSNDIGVSYTYTPVSGGGSVPTGYAPAGYDRAVTHIRWTFTGNLNQTSPNNAGSIGFSVRIR